MHPLDPQAAKRKTQQLDILLAIIVFIVLVGVVYQLFLRYTYVHTVGNTVVRVDRVSGAACTLPCAEGFGQGTTGGAYVPPPSPAPDKACHSASVVRVANSLRPPVTRTPAPYQVGGFHTIAAARQWKKHVVTHAIELTDGHIYVFSKEAFTNDVGNWSTGQDVQVCATWSRLEQRPYYSVGAAGDAQPAALAL
ncbi:MAG: hypothetical protein M3R53_01050 [Candidatus Eremiobacteraeota bacterium]|nr:hypothetical protein [Candidatus Eremiobacteraeota bacterium]